MRIKEYSIRAGALLISSMLLGGCFTGIESTKKITLTKEERKESAPSAEELFLSDVAPSPSSLWPGGKPFLVAGSRGAVLFEPRRIESGSYRIDEGDTLRYIDSRQIVLPDGRSVTGLRFSRGVDEFAYVPSGKDASSEILSDAMPGLLDPEMLSRVDSLLRGRRLWTRSALWEDLSGRRIEGRRYEEIRVREVLPGSMVFPLRVVFLDETGMEGSMLMNFGNSGKDSRGFANLFFLENPRDKYKGINDANWELIRRGNVTLGMTKEECRLAKGNPSEVHTGHDYQHSLLVWNYPDGTMLYFADGLLRGINSIPKDLRD